jgi:hypothetical protein
MHLLTLIATLFISVLLPREGPMPAVQTDWPQWRGPDRTGISTETGLLKEWPQAGPPVVWFV